MDRRLVEAFWRRFDEYVLYGSPTVKRWRTRMQIRENIRKERGCNQRWSRSHATCAARAST